MTISPNADLIARWGSRNDLVTPCLIVDIDVLERNIDTAARLLHAHGKHFRPHAKTHKCCEIARRQLAAGAAGISVATIGEAEIFAANGIDDILITSTFATGRSIKRIVEIARGGCRLIVVADNPHVVAALDHATTASGIAIDVLIDIDMGRNRSGCTNPDDAAALAQTIREAGALNLAGIQAYAGHLSHTASFTERDAAAKRCFEIVAPIRHRLEDEFGQIDYRTGGSTGSLHLDLESEMLTELQCGSSIFMDVEYDGIDPDGSGTWPFETALFVRTTVISANTKGVATTDAGDKRFANKYGAMPRIVSGAPPGSSYRPVSDEHGQICLPENTSMRVGDVVECIVPHCDPTVNLFNQIHVVRDDILIDIWPIDARGAI